ncbi:hypothetical protein [Pseudarthrobacter sp. S9]|uniref:hypothetical protein n=1 Tax=Pseudarthrobacter sp. S9 TaxID=3418421 RepID=UPI003D0839DC
MTAPLSGRAAAFLCRTALLAGILAVIAGILGMHIMTGSHSMTASAAVQDVGMIQAMQSSATGHTSHAAFGAAATDSSPSMTGTSMHGSSCADPGGCAMMTAMDASSCTLSPGNAPLAAPLPGSTSFAVDYPYTRTPASTHSYLPGSPSPGQLCISRT